MNDLMTTAEVAEMLRTPEATLHYWVHNNKGPRSAKIGRRRMWRRADVLEWIDQQFDAETRTA